MASQCAIDYDIRVNRDNDQDGSLFHIPQMKQRMEKSKMQQNGGFIVKAMHCFNLCFIVCLFLYWFDIPLKCYLLIRT